MTVREWELHPARDLGLRADERLGSPRRDPGLPESVAYRLWSAATRGYLRAWHRFEARGIERLPDLPFVLIANHASHLDSIALAAMLPWRVRRHVFPIAAGDVFFKTRLRRALAAYCINALPMWRHGLVRHALADYRERLATEGCGYIIFPEGRRAADGRLGEFKAGLGMLVAGTSVPVVPCRIRGAFEALPKNAWWPRPRRVHVTIGAPLEFASVPNERSGWERVSAEARAAVGGLAG